MMRTRFREWLEREPLKPKAVSDYVTECARVDLHHGNLDDHFERDRMKGLLASLTADRYRDLRADDRMPIRGDLEKNLATYRSAVRKYCSFRMRYV